MRLYQSMHRSSAKYEAQDQLAGKTHYVDDDTLRFHHSRIISCDISHGGRLFWLIESCSLDMNNTKRGFRFVVFDIFGNVISRVGLEDAFKTSKAAKTMLKAFLDNVDADKVTKEGIKKFKKHNDASLAYLNEQLKQLKKGAA